MPIPRVVTRANRRVLNPLLMRHIAGVIPPLMLVRHTGRRSGRQYETPIMAFRHGEGFVIALTYGPGTDWQRNFEAAGTMEAVQRGQAWRLTRPRLIHGPPGSQPLPRIVRFALTMLRVDNFIKVAAERVTP